MKPFVIVAGYQRSGTSFLTKALNFCGVDLGEFTDMTYTHINANSANLSGDWESKKLKVIYDNFFKSSPTLDDLSDVQKFNTITPENKELINDYLESFSQRQYIKCGFKLPNLLMLKHFLDYEPLLIGIFRNPISNAQSCVGRANLKLYKTTLLPKYLQYWKIHNKILFDSIALHGGYLINFDWTPERIISEIHKICDDLGLLKTDLTDWFRKDFIHHDKHRVDLQLDEETVLLHEKLIKMAESNTRILNQTRTEVDYSEVLKQHLTDDVLLTKMTNVAFRKVQDENIEFRNGIINSCYHKIMKHFR